MLNSQSVLTSLANRWLQRIQEPPNSSRSQHRPDGTGTIY